MNSARKYRKKPVVIEAMQWADGNGYHIASWCGGRLVKGETYADNRIVIPTLEGDMAASFYDYVIKGVQGEFYPCKPDIFEATYEPVDVTHSSSCGCEDV